MKKPKNIYTIIFLILSAAWFLVITQENAISSPQNIDNKNLDKSFVGIAKVTDGDSIKVEDKRIRLIGIDAPEYSQTCFNADYEEYECGKISKGFLTNLAHNKEVKCYYEKFDKYNRYLSECYVADKMINQEILRHGMGVFYTFGPKDLEMQRLEFEAQEKRIGIWQGAFQLPKDYRKSHKKK